MLIGKLEDEIRARGLPVQRERDGGDWLSVRVPQALITIEPRPSYCDRGNFIVKVFPRGDLALSLDDADAFPRYYFGVRACADELLAWMQARQLIEALR